jgi:hypothetical protein
MQPREDRRCGRVRAGFAIETFLGNMQNTGIRRQRHYPQRDEQASPEVQLVPVSSLKK